MSTKETIQKAYGGIPKEVGLNLGGWEPVWRGVRYYWLVFIRKFRKLG